MKNRKILISIMVIVIVFLVVTTILSVVRFSRLQGDFDTLSSKVNLGEMNTNAVVINSGAPSAGKITFCKAVEEYIFSPIFVTAETDNELGALGVCPRGIPVSRNKATLAVFRTDVVTEGAANAEFLEISAGSPCWRTDDFLMGVGTFGEGIARSLSFGAKRTGEGVEYQIAFTIKTQDSADIYTCFAKDVELLGDLITSCESGLGLFGVMPVGQQSHIDDADGTIEDLTHKFNELLGVLEAYGLLSDGNE